MPQFSMASFVALAVTASATIGMGNVITTFYALHLGAGSFQVGLISGAQSFGMMLMTMPAGFIIAKYGARRVYLLVEHHGHGGLPDRAVARDSGICSRRARGFIGLCAPFRHRLHEQFVSCSG